MYFALILITVTEEQVQSTVHSCKMDANGFRDDLEFTGDYTHPFNALRALTSS